MKKVGLIIFAIALVVGLVVTNIFSVGRATNGLFKFSVNFDSVKGSGNIISESRDEVSGAANVILNGIDNTELSVESSGASKIKIAGETAKLTVDVSGATQIDAEELNAGDADVEASGASHVNVKVSGSLRTEASGASKIVYIGEPSSVERKTSGASSVSRK